jgi:hypothetical protein
MADSSVTWRERYTELCKEGEAKGLTFIALGHHIASGMTDVELRAMLAEWAPVLDGIRNPLDQPPQGRQQP